MHQSQHGDQTEGSEQKSGGVARDRSLVPVLNEISRKLDMNASSAISAVREELKALLAAGKINPPVRPDDGFDKLSVSDILRRIASEEGFESSHKLIEKLPAKSISKKITDARKAPPPYELDTMSTPDLNLYISQQIAFHNSFESIRDPKKNYRGPRK